jgi:hypothetical protein
MPSTTRQSQTRPETSQAGLRPLPGFQAFKTHHCVTGSMKHIYHYHQHPLSEDMLLGLGAGIGFFYWHMKGQMPMLLGRGNVHRPGVEGLEIDTGRRSGVVVQRFMTKSARKGQNALFAAMEAQQPLMIHVDMGFLPYFDLPDGYHFGQHVVVVAGLDLDTQQVLLADRDGALHAVNLQDLARARGSTYKPFAPMNTCYSFDFTEKRLPQAGDIWRAIADVCESMLRGPISNLGVRGMRRAAQAVAEWPCVVDKELLGATMFNSYIFIDAEGGTGGGMFRYMYSRFLTEAVDICSCPELLPWSQALKSSGDAWQEVAMVFKEASTREKPSRQLEALSDPLLRIADQELAIWEGLDKLSSVALS